MYYLHAIITLDISYMRNITFPFGNLKTIVNKLGGVWSFGWIFMNKYIYFIHQEKLVLNC